MMTRGSVGCWGSRNDSCVGPFDTTGGRPEYVTLLRTGGVVLAVGRGDDARGYTARRPIHALDTLYYMVRKAG